jgi:hypothetical protein
VATFIFLLFLKNHRTTFAVKLTSYLVLVPGTGLVLQVPNGSVRRSQVQYVFVVVPTQRAFAPALKKRRDQKMNNLSVCVFVYCLSDPWAR